MAPVVLAVSGASAMPLAERSLQLLLEAGEEVELIASRGAIGVWLAEQGVRIPSEPELQTLFWRERTGVSSGQLRCHRWNDQAAAIASGSFPTRGMVILPASMGTVGRIASGVATDLVERVADVHLKEGRPLVIAPREMPWNLIHLRNLTALAEAGARIAPPIPAWYHRPTTLEEMVDFLVIRVFDSLGYELGALKRWEGPVDLAPTARTTA
ncbi:UbiX family flavin prenyltransferase [Synechococcus sp. CS-602]|uniref:flavin prenyltransferase UbiX n=1 Tax=Synechococcaceae TaxID=1890426 RepID=UPI0008FF42A3|nr:MULTISPECIES: flavin prenyltransferase UbiX [Synechococcaceae]MCT4365122.1 UbiX family flavin prenyltransferase [Candidatus Regnicoccus frigidus MAG-AL1]APD47281.1 amino acid decarboxylase [Synechococcus sp. SynAce01]MCT0202065.1 UbiX family flavin prenyltransferase [Synechococcus sp. CS-603]MCT0205755.1 UbiX family flavin prenyltransferase [Synechococcus sp. CS-602]MCT0244843.1 UbiX family flavin prenyltransferase [Synechococcus sp. CS-601]